MSHLNSDEKNFSFAGQLELTIPFQRIVLSLGEYVSPDAKDVNSTQAQAHARKTVIEHIESLLKFGRIKPDHPVLVISIRNVLSNLRCGVWVKGLTASFITVQGESTVATRPYHIIGMRKGNLFAGELVPTKDSLADFDWLFSGVPVVWDSKTVHLNRIVTEVADPAHIWKLPRGHHPDKTSTSEKQWEEMNKIFCNSLTWKREAAGEAILTAATEMKLERESNYLHNLLGIDADRNLLQLIAVGTLENLGNTMKRMGATHALMVDNGGSIAVHFYPKGVKHHSLTLMTAPNHRLAGTAYLFVELPNSKFSICPISPITSSVSPAMEHP